MKVDVRIMAVAGFAASLVQGAHAAPCPSGTVSVDLTSDGDLLDLADSLYCAGQVAYKVTLYGRLGTWRPIEVSDGKTMTVTGSNDTQRDSTGGAYDVIYGVGAFGIFRVTNGSTLTLKNLALAGGNSVAGGAVELDSHSSLIAFDCEFTDNSGYKGGAIYAHDSEVYIGRTTYFRHNVGDFGGALYLSNSRIGIYGSAQFAYNSATNHGGGIYSSNKVASTLIFGGETMFGGNVAEGDGGAIHIGSMDEVNITDITFTENTADQGGAVFVASSKSLTRKYDNCSFRDNSATNGGALYLSGGDVGYDHITASTFDGNYASTSGGAIYLYSGGLEVDGSDFTANQAGQEGTAIASVSILTPMNLSNVVFDGNSLYCPLGQYGSYVYVDPVSPFLMVCERCSAATDEVPDTVSVDQGTPVCYDLPTGTVPRSAGTTLQNITLAAGYYRTSQWSDVLLKCHRIEACPGGNDPQNYCAAGYQGVYCATCSEGYSPGLNYSCRLCSEGDKRSAVGMAFAVAVVALLSAVMVLRHLGNVTDRDIAEGPGTSGGVIRRTCASFQSLLLKALPLTAIKIIVVVWQVVIQFAPIAEDIYPEEYKVFLSYVSFAIFDISNIVSYSCLFFPDFYGRLLLMTIAPLLVLTILAVAYYVAIGNFTRSTQHLLLTARNRHLSAALFVAFFVYSSVSSTIFQTFLCEDVGGISHLTADYSISCDNAWHDNYKVYASFMTIVYPIGIPAVFCWWLVQNRENLNISDRHTIAYLQPFNSIWGTYRRSRYYYEVVEYCRRLTLSISSVFLAPNSVNQIAVVLSLAAVFMFVSESLSPFERSLDMSLYRWGNVIILASMYIALLMKADESEEDSGAFTVFGWVLITANVMLIVAVAVQAVLLAQTWRGEQATAEHVVPHVCRRQSSSCSGNVRPSHTTSIFARRWPGEQTRFEQIIQPVRRPSAVGSDYVRSNNTTSISARSWRGEQTRIEQIIPPVCRPSSVRPEDVRSSRASSVFGDLEIKIARL